MVLRRFPCFLPSSHARICWFSDDDRVADSDDWDSDLELALSSMESGFDEIMSECAQGSVSDVLWSHGLVVASRAVRTSGLSSDGLVLHVCLSFFFCFFAFFFASRSLVSSSWAMRSSMFALFFLALCFFLLLVLPLDFFFVVALTFIFSAFFFRIFFLPS